MLPPPRFETLVKRVTGSIADRKIDENLAEFLAKAFPPSGPLFNELEQLCKEGAHAGWLCQSEAGGIRFGRVLRAGPATHGFSVDVVEMSDIVGPHHRHPGGEIDMIMPLDPGARFDGETRGWKVYGPGSAHHPTVAGGSALVLYLLPQGAIEFTRA